MVFYSVHCTVEYHNTAKLKSSESFETGPDSDICGNLVNWIYCIKVHMHNNVHYLIYSPIQETYSSRRIYRDDNNNQYVLLRHYVALLMHFFQVDMCTVVDLINAVCLNRAPFVVLRTMMCLHLQLTSTNKNS